MGSTAQLALQAGQLFISAKSQGQSADISSNEGATAKALGDARALDALSLGDQQASRLGMQTRGLIGAEKAAAGGSGVDINSGSAADVQADSARLGAMDQLTIKNNAAREAWGFRTQGTLDQQAADNRARAQRAGETSTLLTGAANLYDAWSKNPPRFGRSGGVPSSGGGLVPQGDTPGST